VESRTCFLSVTHNASYLSNHASNSGARRHQCKTIHDFLAAAVGGLVGVFSGVGDEDFGHDSKGFWLRGFWFPVKKAKAANLSGVLISLAKLMLLQGKNTTGVL
jgi:hypothetical protein